MNCVRSNLIRARPSSWSKCLYRFQQRSTTTTSTNNILPTSNTTTTTKLKRLPLFHKFLYASTATIASATAFTFAIAEYDQQNTQMTENKLPRTYDAKAIANFWSEHNSIVACRIFSITTTVIPFLIRAGTSILLTKQWEKEKQSEWGVELRDMLSKLGPTFIKFGQMLSIRPDILPTPVLVELQKLCDAVPAFDTNKAIDLIEDELGGPVSNWYTGLTRDSVPIAAASLGQVYKCKLVLNHKSGNGGQEVAVKVQRPDMVRAVSLDLYILRKYTQFIERFKSVLMNVGYLSPRKQFDVQLLDTFANASFYELDYVHEAKNQERFSTSLNTPNIYVPQVYRPGTTRKVLTTEWINGIQLAKSSPETIRRLIPCGVECFLAQLLTIGFFHSDPHPGNLLVNEKGQLVLIDFGLCAEVDQPDTKGMTSAIVHLMRGDVAALIEDAIALRFLPKDVEKDTLLPALQKVFDSAQLADQELSLSSNKFDFKTQERRAQFKHISRDLNKIFYDFPFVVPEYFALITRALIVLEGIAVTGDPNFDIFAAAYPFAQSRALEIFGWSGLARIGVGAAGVVQDKIVATSQRNDENK